MNIIQKIQKYLREERGFTLIELIMSMVIISAVMGVATKAMMEQGEINAFVSERKQSISQMRYSFKKISHELKRLEQNDIEELSPNEFSFTDTNGESTSYKISSYGENMAIYRGDVVLIPDVDSFTFRYFGEDGLVLEDDDEDKLENVRAIEIVAKVNAGDDTMSMKTRIVPRAFLGIKNYQ